MATAPKPGENNHPMDNLRSMHMHTKCPAVLTENLFQTNKEDVAYLESDKGFKTIVDIHVQGIKNYIDRVSKEKSE